MPRPKKLFKGPLLRERLLIMQGKKQGIINARQAKHKMDNAVKWHISNTPNGKLVVELSRLPAKQQRQKWQRHLKNMEKMKKRIPLKDPKKVYSKILERINAVKKLEKETFAQVKEVSGITITQSNEPHKSLIIIWPEQLRLMHFGYAASILSKACKKQEKLVTEINNRLLEVQLSIERTSTSKQKKELFTSLEQIDPVLKEVHGSGLSIANNFIKELIANAEGGTGQN